MIGHSRHTMTSENLKDILVTSQKIAEKQSLWEGRQKFEETSNKKNNSGITVLYIVFKQNGGIKITFDGS